MHKKIFVYLVILPIVFYVQSDIMVSSNKERGAPKRAQRYKVMNMNINEAVITGIFQSEIERLVEFLCEPGYEGVAQIIQTKLSPIGSGMLRTILFTSEDFVKAFALVDFLDKEAKAAEVVAKMIREEVLKNL